MKKKLLSLVKSAREAEARLAAATEAVASARREYDLASEAHLRADDALASHVRGLVRGAS